MSLIGKNNYYAKTIYSSCLLAVSGAHFVFWVLIVQHNYSISIITLFLLLSCYFILLFSLKIETDRNAEDYLYKFLQISAIVDCKRVNDRHIDRLIDSVIECTNHNRIYFLVRNGCIIPCTIMLLEIIALLIVVNPFIALLFVISSATVVSFVILIVMVLGIKNNVSQIAVYNFSHTLMKCARGIKLYDAYEFARKKIKDMMSEHVNVIACKYKKTILRTLLIYVFLLLSVGVILFYGSSVINQVYEYNGIFIVGTILVVVVFVASFGIRGKNKLVDFQSAFNGKIIYIDQNVFEEKLQIEDTFITFNNITIFDKDDRAVIRNVSFAIDDNDFVVVVGEGSSYAQYIYDLIFKHYECKDGLVYIGGIRSTSLPVSVISSAIGYFDEDFCLIFGTVFENISIGSSVYENIMFAAEVACLYEDELNMDVFDQDGNIAINQCLKLKIQIARMMLCKYKAIIVNTPSYYESKENEAIFYNFVKVIMHSKTVILSTTNLNFIMYSNKVLYFGKHSYCFGAHSEILCNSDYMHFLRASDYDVCTNIDVNEDKLM